MSEPADFQPIFNELKSYLSRHAAHLITDEDAPDSYSLVTKLPRANKQPIWFGAVYIRKNYVSYQLVPVYACPELLEGMSAPLKKRMQGKSYFNFKKPDAALFAELAALTEAGYKCFQEKFGMK